VLEWLLIIELIALGAAALFGLVALIIARQDKNDPIYVWCSVFWRNFLWPPLVMELDNPRMGPVRQYSEKSPAPSAAAPDTSDEDAKYGRVKRDRDGRIATATLPLLVMPNSAKDRVIGVEDGGLKIEMTGEAGEGRTNKALIDLVSNAIGVKPYQVTITKGHYHPQKTVQIQGMRPDELEAKLAAMV